MAGQVVHGHSSVVDNASTARAWQIAMNEAAAAYTASGMSRGIHRVAGVRRWQGVYVAYGATPVPFPGATFTFTGNTDGSNGYTGTAWCERVRVTWDPLAQDPRPIHHTVFFRSAGALTAGSASASDSTVPNAKPATGLKVNFDGSDATHVHGAQLDIFARWGKRYADTESSFWEVWLGGAIDAEAWWDVFEDDPSNLPSLQSEGVLKMYDDTSTYWQLVWGRITGVPNFQVDHEGPRPVFGRVQAEFTGFAGGTNTGSITDPATSVRWP